MNDQKNWIATRTLTQVGQSPTQIEVSLGTPEQVSDQEWRCPYFITDAENKVRFAHGLDAFQSLMLALVAIRAHLDAFYPSYTWVSEQAGDTGFPKSVPTYFGFDFTQKMEQMLTLETDKFALELQERYQKNQASS